LCRANDIICFPQFVNDVVDLDAGRQQTIQKNVSAGITRLGGFQVANGGLSYWQEIRLLMIGNFVRWSFLD
jgi:hypothetical protein